jgi:hypothetical protein
MSESTNKTNNINIDDKFIQRRMTFQHYTFFFLLVFQLVVFKFMLLLLENREKGTSKSCEEYYPIFLIVKSVITLLYFSIFLYLNHTTIISFQELNIKFNPIYNNILIVISTLFLFLIDQSSPLDCYWKIGCSLFYIISLSILYFHFFLYFYFIRRMLK